MATAKSVIDVILGEAKGKSYQDMLHIASVIANRSRDLRVTPQEVVSNRNEFNAYGIELPEGAENYRSLAEKALAEVQTKGPVTPAKFFATRNRVGGLPKGLQEVAAVPGGGHVFFVDPENRAINTAVGTRQVKPVQNSLPQLTGPASASAVGSANLGKGNGLGMANLAPDGLRRNSINPSAGVESLHPALRARANAFLDKAKEKGLDLVFKEGFRTDQRQNELFAKGRTVEGGKVTNARGGKSNHNYSVAFDVVPRSLEKTHNMSPESPLWGKIGEVAHETGLEWGGDWTEFIDKPHVQAQGAHWRDLRNLPVDSSGFVKLPEDVETAMYYLPEKVPVPTPRQPMALMAQAKAADRTYNPGGIVGAKAISLNLVPSANAGEMPKITRSALPAIQERIRPMPTSAPAKTSTGVGYSLPKAQPLSDSAFSARYSPPQPAPKPSGPQTLYNRSGGAANDFRPMPTGTIPQRVSAPVQSTHAPRYNPLPSGPVAPSVSPQTMAAAYGQYAQTRMAAPSTPMQANPAAAPFTVKATAGQMTTQPIVGPLSNAPIQAPVAATTGQFKKFTPIQKIQQKLKTAVEPENLKAMGGQLAGGAAGSLLGGPIGGILGGLIGKQIMSQPQGQGLLAGLFGGGATPYGGQINNIGSGIRAVDRAMYGGQAGDRANYSSQGGGTVTNIGGGASQRTSAKYGWTETTHADGSKSIKYK